MRGRLKRADAEVINLLKKVISKIKEKPELVRGYDVSWKEVSFMVEMGKVPVSVLIHAGGDHAFLIEERERLGLTLKEAKRLKGFLKRADEEDLLKLKEDIPYLTSEDVEEYYEKT
ncbi:hypothetical protein DRN62_00495 [Nanoarchaeota archaeon]|nr:MAG: hypothetical protein DRN62_00495 [Nanoarchaeota archaeon]